jgi:glycogen debranching enzyme
MRSTMPRPQTLLAILFYVSLCTDGVFAQTVTNPLPSSDSLTLSTDTVSPLRFIAAHGRRALISGYASGGLEIWAYPFEVLNNYQVSFREKGTTTPIEGQAILRRVQYNTNSITRVYLGRDFIVRENFFVPLNEPGAIITYSVQSAHPVFIDVHATPILNLMWPAAVGGQSAAWNPTLSAFLISESSTGYSAVVASPDIIAHDDLGNRTTQGPNGGAALAFTLRPSSSGNASVYIALNLPGTHDGSSVQALITNQDALHEQSNHHVANLMHTMIKVTTPDDRVNQAIAWSELALDQAWVCSSDLGCGYVAGYGPSRGARRPQYDWFFAGDGLIAANAAATAGNASQARSEFEFILRYQDKKTGMIWHELSQSAGFIDWAGKYPYMYVHVDITFQFLGTLARYVTTTGDVEFVRDHWPAISAAYRYCESLIDPATGLPRIPSDKEGGDEQDRMSDDLGLSVSWVEATSAFQQFAKLTGHPEQAADAESANHRARASIPTRYWDAQNSFWISGHVESGRAIPERRNSPGEAIAMDLFTPQQNQLLLDQFASASFQTDWGSRGVAAGSQGFDPTSYANGSVSALGTAELATTFWSAHRSTQAFAMYNSLLPWTSLDSLGHLHEVLAGNIYQPQEESVPEQTWSSAGFVTATLKGLLGLQVDALARTITFAPHIPTSWHDLSVNQIPLSGATISFTLHQDKTDMTLRIDNSGPPFSLTFAPTLPLGASVDRVEWHHHKIPAATMQNLPDTLASLNVSVVHGANEIDMVIHGGVSIIPTNSSPLLGDPSRGIHIIDVHLAGNSLKITADIPADQSATIDVATAWPISNSTNAKLVAVTSQLDRVTLLAPSGTPVVDHYQHVEATFELKR